MDLITLVIFVTFLNLSPPFWMCNIQLQRVTAPSPACLFFIHFCLVVGFEGNFGSSVIRLKRKWNKAFADIVHVMRRMEMIVTHKGRACNLCCRWFCTEIHVGCWRPYPRAASDWQAVHGPLQVHTGLLSVKSHWLLHPVMRRTRRSHSRNSLSRSKLVSSEYLSFFSRTIIQWNNLPASVFSEHSLDTFTAHVSCLNHLLAY